MRVRTKHPSLYKEMIVVMRGGFGDLDSKMSTMIGKQDLMLEKQEQTTGEIRDARSDRKVMRKWSAQDSGSESGKKLGAWI